MSTNEGPFSGRTDSWGGITREQKAQRLRRRQIQSTNVAANVFSSNVPARKRRYIVGIFLSQITNSPVSITLSKILNSAAAETFLKNVVIDAQGNLSLNQGSIVNLDHPLEVLTGGQNFQVQSDAANNIQVTVWWVDFPR